MQGSLETAAQLRRGDELIEYGFFSDSEFEYRAASDGLGVVSGVIVRYGDVAKLGMGLTEQIERGAFSVGGGQNGGPTGCTTARTYSESLGITWC